MSKKQDEKDERHGAFMMWLGERLMVRYTDGGAGYGSRDRRKAKAAKLARRRNR